MKHYDGNVAGKEFALWGLSFKPNTDDMREAPSRVLLEALWSAGAKVKAYDPQAMEETKRIYGERDDLVLCDNPEQVLASSDALIIVTEWNVFRSPDFATLKEKLNSAVVFDGRNIYNPETMKEYGFTYYSIGRLPVDTE